MLSRKASKVLLVTLIVLAPAVPAAASSIWLGIDDHPLADQTFSNMVLNITSSSLITVTGVSGGWQAMVIPNSDYSPYWDGYSSELGQANVGFYLLGTGYYAGNPASPDIALSNLQYWGTEVGGADSSVSFSSPGSLGVTMTLELTGNADVNSFGWFYLSAPNSLMQVFSGPQGPGATATITTSGAPIGFYLNNEFGTETTTQNSVQFAEFEDTSGVPEPTTCVMIGLGLLLLGFAGKRRHHRAVAHS
jgi:hypothetical protein